MNIPSASSRQLDKNKLYHWPGFTPPQPQNAAASVAYFVTAVNNKYFFIEFFAQSVKQVSKEEYEDFRKSTLLKAPLISPFSGSVKLADGTIRTANVGMFRRGDCNDMLISKIERRDNDGKTLKGMYLLKIVKPYFRTYGVDCDLPSRGEPIEIRFENLPQSVFDLGDGTFVTWGGGGDRSFHDI